MRQKVPSYDLFTYMYTNFKSLVFNLFSSILEPIGPEIGELHKTVSQVPGK